MFGYLDCSSGISGDKFLGALIDAGLSPDTLRDRMRDLPLPGCNMTITEVTRGGLRGLAVTVRTSEGQPHRTWRDIRQLLDEAGLPAPVHAGASTAFALLAEAEAEVHGVAADEVHFHEVGAADSIIDVVGTAVGLAELGVDELWASPVCTGSGTVQTEHGTLPVPAPATSRLLAGIPTFAGEAAGEMTTPTGAALLRAFVSRFAPCPPVTPLVEGYGAGSRDPAGVPNVARLTLGDRGTWDGADEQVTLLESVIDHLSPEHLAVALELVREAGALDVWQTPVVMKKGRLAVEVTVMTRPGDAPRLTTELMAQTGTLGVRRTEVWRSVAKRSSASVDTELGRVRMKTGAVGGTRHSRPESDDVARIAREIGEGVARVAKRLSQASGEPGPHSGTE